MLFDKNVSVPIDLLKAEALLERVAVPPQRRSEIASFIKRMRSGFNGEKTINYYLSLIPEKKLFIFHDLRLPIGGDKFFQMDVVLLTPRAILILEGKNHSGILTLEKNQMIQETLGSREIYENPIAQAQRHKILLKNWLDKHQFPSIPIDFLVVVSKPSTEIIISADYREVERKICRSYDLLNEMEVFNQTYRKECTDDKTVNKLRRLFLNKHTPKQTDILDRFEMKQSELMPGVQCPNCSKLPMSYKKGSWLCLSCGLVSKDAHLKAIDDYFLLIGPSVTNSDLRRFLQLPTSRSTTHLLSLLNLPNKGVSRNRIYFLSQI